MVTVQITLIISTAMPRPNEVRQTTGSGSSSAIDSGETAIAPPISATNRMGRRGAQRSEASPPAISPTDSAEAISPQAAAPPRCDRATAGPSTWKPPYQAASTTVYWSTIAHSQVCERNSDQPSRSSRSMLGACPRCRAGRPGRIASISGTVPSIPAPQASSAQPGPNSATHSPASAAPAIVAAFMPSRLIALACCIWSGRTRAGSSAADAG